MVKDFKTIIRIGLLGLFILIIGGYTLFTARNIITGPVIKLIEPENGDNLEKSMTIIKGETRNVVSINFNDNPITINERGDFEEKIILARGYNIIKLEAEDRFGRKKVTYLELIYKL